MRLSGRRTVNSQIIHNNVYSYSLNHSFRLVFTFALLFALFAGATNAHAAPSSVQLLTAWPDALNVTLGVPNLPNLHRARFINTGTSSERVLLDLEIHSSLGRIAQAFEERTLAPGEMVELPLTAKYQPYFPNGKYAFKVGIFTPGWAELVRWHDEAATTTVTGSSGAATNGTPTLRSASLDRTTMVRGVDSVRGTASISNSSSASMPVIIDYEVYRGTTKVYQVFWGENVPAGGAVTKAAILGIGHLPVGDYTWKIGVFRSDWSGPLAWFDAAGKFEVIEPGISTTTPAATSSPPSGVRGDVAMVFAKQNNPSISVGSTTNLNVSLNLESGDWQDILVDVELYNESGAMMHQAYKDNLKFRKDTAAFRSEDFTSPETLPAGTYHWKVGVFEAGWTKLLHWHDKVSTLTISP